MKLAVFDVDGTLVRTGPEDDQCFVRAFGAGPIPTDWASYGHVTDAWLTRTILRGLLGRDPTRDEVARVRGEYFRLARAHRYPPTPGASPRLFRDLAAAGWRAVVATGGWRCTARHKLRSAGLSLAGAYADHHETREGVIEKACARAERMWGEKPERTVYVGDRVWDMRACRALAMPFVGIAGHDARLEGASRVLPDFRDFGRLAECLETAAVP